MLPIRQNEAEFSKLSEAGNAAVSPEAGLSSWSCLFQPIAAKQHMASVGGFVMIEGARRLPRVLRRGRGGGGELRPRRLVLARGSRRQRLLQGQRLPVAGSRGEGARRGGLTLQHDVGAPSRHVRRSCSAGDHQEETTR